MDEHRYSPADSSFAKSPPSAAAFEPMSVSGILDRTFRLYRRNFVRFITIAAVVQVPLLIVGLVPTVLSRKLFDPQQATWAAGEPPPIEVLLPALLVTTISLLVYMVLAVVGSTLSSGALAKAVSESYLGRESSVAEVYRFVLPRFGSLLGASLLIALLTLVGYLVCVVPGVLVSLWLAVATPAIVIEGAGAIDGMQRSKALTSGNLGKVFLVGLLTVLLALVIQWPVVWLAGLLGKYLSREVSVALGVIVQQVLAFPMQLIATPIISTALVLLYYDLRIRKEGFDLEVLAQSMTRR